LEVYKKMSVLSGEYCRLKMADRNLLLHHSGARLHAKPADTPAAPEREDYYGR
jgi:hypothetical protein